MANSGHIFIRNNSNVQYKKPGHARPKFYFGSHQPQYDVPPADAIAEVKKEIAERPENAKMNAARQADPIEKMRNGIDAQVSFEKSEAEKTGQVFNEPQTRKHWEGVADRLDNRGK